MIKIYSPVKGEVKKLENVSDPAFSSKVMGEGIAVIPYEGKIYAPVDGVVSMVFPTHHALGLKGEDGVEVLIHIGIDTVELEGKGFSSLVAQGDIVKRGQLLVEVDLDVVEMKYESDTMVIITNTKDYNTITCTDENEVNVDDLLISIE